MKLYNKRSVLTVVVCFILAMALTACASADFIGNRYQIGDTITVEFKVMNTTLTEKLDLKAGDTVRFDVTSESGSIDLTFGIKDAAPEYEGKSVESGSFTVTVHEDGRYILNITGSGAKGCVIVTAEEQS